MKFWTLPGDLQLLTFERHRRRDGKTLRKRKTKPTLLWDYGAMHGYTDLTFSEAASLLWSFRREARLSLWI